MALSGDDVCDLVAIIEEMAESCDGEPGDSGDDALIRVVRYDPVKLALVDRARRGCAARRSALHPGLGQSRTHPSREQPE